MSDEKKEKKIEKIEDKLFEDDIKELDDIQKDFLESIKKHRKKIKKLNEDLDLDEKAEEAKKLEIMQEKNNVDDVVKNLWKRNLKKEAEEALKKTNGISMEEFRKKLKSQKESTDEEIKDAEKNVKKEIEELRKEEKKNEKRGPSRLKSFFRKLRAPISVINGGGEGAITAMSNALSDMAEALFAIALIAVWLFMAFRLPYIKSYIFTTTSIIVMVVSGMLYVLEFTSDIVSEGTEKQNVNVVVNTSDKNE